MGVDIHFYLVDERDDSIRLTTEDLYEGRCSSWFSNMQQQGDNIVYDYMPVVYNYEWKNMPENCFYNDDDAYGHRAAKVTDLLKWHDRYKPFEDGVYLTEREKWLYETKGIIEENSLRHYPDKSENATIFTPVTIYDPMDNILHTIFNEVAGTEKFYWLLWCFDC